MAALGRPLLAGQERLSSLSTQPWWGPPGVMCPVLGFPVQERHGTPGSSPAKGYQNDEGSGASPIYIFQI